MHSRQDLPLLSGDAGHQRKVIVAVAAFVTEWEPRAHVAMLDGLRVSVRYDRKRLVVIAPDLTEVRNIAPNWELLRLPSAAEHNMHKLGLDALNLCKEVRIEAELNDRSCFG